MTTRRWALGALGAIALAAPGCSSGSGTGAADGSGTAGDRAVRFAQCMRDHGVREFPDPDASGELSLDGVVNGSELDPSSPVWERAMAACADLEPAGFTGDPRSAEQQDAALRFADCIREHGVEDFPDPAEGEPLVDTRRIPSTDRPGGMDVLNAAMQACRDAAAQAIGEQP